MSRNVFSFFLLIFLWCITGCGTINKHIYKYHHDGLDDSFKEAGLEKSVTEFEETKISSWSGGDGCEHLILLHGFGGDSQNQWRYQVPLAEHYILHAPDMVYFGESTSSSGLYTLEFEADSIVRYMDENNISRAHIAGVSLGGLVAYILADKYPGRVDKLIIADSPGGEFTKADYEYILAYYDKSSLSDIIFAAKPDDVPRLFSIIYHDPPYYPGFIIDSIHKNLLIVQIEQQKKLAEYIESNYMDLTRKTYDIPHDMLIIWGRYDRFFPLNIGIRLANRHKAPLKVIDNAAHSPNLEKDEEFNRIVHAFLKEGSL